jgi:hypothetical protein
MLINKEKKMAITNGLLEQGINRAYSRIVFLVSRVVELEREDTKAKARDGKRESDEK